MSATLNAPSGFEIAGRKIGGDGRCFVIAEAGVNHNGDEKLARDLVAAAADAGADCVKFQTFSADDLVLSDAPKARYQLTNTGNMQSQLDMLRALELPRRSIEHLMVECERRKILFLSTPYSYADVELLNELGVAGFKLASIHAAEPAFVRFVAGRGKPFILSSGLCTLAEVDRAVTAARQTGNRSFAVLQCTTDYPSVPEDANLNAMVAMGRALDVIVGYSDHTEHPEVAAAAVALGAKVIEKHLTLDRGMPGPDHSSSLDPSGFAAYVASLRSVEAALGSPAKGPTAREGENAAVMRRCLVMRVDRPAGHKLSVDDVTFMRPLAAGVPVADLDRVVGRPLTRAMVARAPLTWDDI